MVEKARARREAEEEAELAGKGKPAAGRVPEPSQAGMDASRFAR